MPIGCCTEKLAGVVDTLRRHEEDCRGDELQSSRRPSDGKSEERRQVWRRCCLVCRRRNSQLRCQEGRIQERKRIQFAEREKGTTRFADEKAEICYQATEAPRRWQECSQ